MLLHACCVNASVQQVSIGNSVLQVHFLCLPAYIQSEHQPEMSVLQMPVAVQPDIQPRLAKKQGLSWGTADCRKALLAGISAHLLSPRPAQSACMPQAECLKSFLPLYRCYGGPKACQTDAASCTGEIKVSHTQQNYFMRIEGLSCHRKGSQTQKALPGKLRLMKLVTEHKASLSSLAVRIPTGLLCILICREATFMACSLNAEFLQMLFLHAFPARPGLLASSSQCPKVPSLP